MIQDDASPLYVASQNGHNGVVQLLLDGGASVDLPAKVQCSLSSSAWQWNGLSHLEA